MIRGGFSLRSIDYVFSKFLDFVLSVNYHKRMFLNEMAHHTEKAPKKFNIDRSTLKLRVSATVRAVTFQKRTK